MTLSVKVVANCRLNSQKKKLLQDIKQEQQQEAEEIGEPNKESAPAETTTNGVF